MTSFIRSEEMRRYCAKWPEIDRQRWQRKLRSSPPDWSDQTCKDYVIGYTRGIEWLRQQGYLDEGRAPEHHWNDARLRAYRTHLGEKSATSRAKRPTSIHMRVVAIERVLSFIAPRFDRQFIGDQAKVVRRQCKPPRKELDANIRLKEFGIELMVRATARGSDSPRAITLYRTGLQIAFLALRPLRIRDFARIRVARRFDSLDECEMKIFPLGDKYWVTGLSSKTKVEINFEYPPELVGQFESYLLQWRPAICRNRYQGDALWVSSKGCAQGVGSIYKQIISRTRELRRKGVNPHLFRDHLATVIARTHPDAWDSVHRILGNSPEILDKYYDHSNTLDAGRRIAQVLTSLIEEHRSSVLRWGAAGRDVDDYRGVPQPICR